MAIRVQVSFRVLANRFGLSLPTTNRCFAVGFMACPFTSLGASCRTMLMWSIIEMTITWPGLLKLRVTPRQSWTFSPCETLRSSTCQASTVSWSHVSMSVDDLQWWHLIHNQCSDFGWSTWSLLVILALVRQLFRFCFFLQDSNTHGV